MRCRGQRAGTYGGCARHRARHRGYGQGEPDRAGAIFRDDAPALGARTPPRVPTRTWCRRCPANRRRALPRLHAAAPLAVEPRAPPFLVAPQPVAEGVPCPRICPTGSGLGGRSDPVRSSERHQGGALAQLPCGSAMRRCGSSPPVAPAPSLRGTPPPAQHMRAHAQWRVPPLAAS